MCVIWNHLPKSGHINFIHCAYTTEAEFSVFPDIVTSLTSFLLKQKDVVLTMQSYPPQAENLLVIGY